MDYSRTVGKGGELKKLFIYAIALILFSPAWATSNIKIFDNNLYSEVLSQTSTSESDIKLYRQIFTAIRNNDIATADKLTSQLKSRALIGHVLAQKYLSKYKSSYQELQQWLKQYSYLPQKNAIAALAITKAPGYKPKKAKPTAPKMYVPYAWYKDSYSQLKPADRKFVREKIVEFVRAIRRTDNKKAEAIMHDTKFRMTIPDKRYDGMSANLAASYFYDGDYERALQWTQKAVKRSHDATAAWFGGLAAWKMGDYRQAAEMFSKVKDEDAWLTSAGAYWAYRSYLQLKDTPTALKYLRQSAANKRTFYGILAQVMLDRKPEYNWQPEAHFNNLQDKGYYEELLKSPSIKRALLLIKSGEYDLAESDLRKNYSGMSSQQKELVMFLSGEHSFANLSFVTANGLKNYGQNRDYDAFMYPYPDWKPQGGWKVNPAWVFALIRQESLFMDKIKSHAGACGLMQLMPSTAAMVAKNRKYAKGCQELFDKPRNLQIGQNYVKMLLEDKNVGDNMFFLAASYNGGPHNVKKWVNRQNYDNDPLLFVEMIPWRETRLYVKKVVANYWIYNSRLGKDSQSLKQLSTGQWPHLD